MEPRQYKGRGRTHDGIYKERKGWRNTGVVGREGTGTSKGNTRRRSEKDEREETSQVWGEGSGRREK